MRRQCSLYLLQKARLALSKPCHFVPGFDGQICGNQITEIAIDGDHPHFCAALGPQRPAAQAHVLILLSQRQAWS